MEQEILRIDSRLATPDSRRLLVRLAKHDRANQPLQRPAVLYKLRGQIVEQLQMCRRLSKQAKIIDARHDSAPEQVTPDTVNHNAADEWVRRINKLPCQLQSPAPRLPTPDT